MDSSKLTKKKKWLPLLNIASSILVVLMLIGLALWGYRIYWTGFSDYITPKGEFLRGKTFWDWMGLLLIPLVLGIGAFFLNRSERKIEREIAIDRQQEDALQAYLDRMSDLLLKENLQTSEKEKIRNVARIRTITVFQGLDPRRKRYVILFLKEAGFLTLQQIFGGDEREIDLAEISLDNIRFEGVNLAGANLRKASLRNSKLNNAILSNAKLNEAHLDYADLREVQLDGASIFKSSLFEANLERANLTFADLQIADLRGCNLSGANLTNASLIGANLRGCNLSGANLTGASLCNANLANVFMLGANLIRADLRGARVSTEQLAEARYLQGALMPDGKMHD
jgi:uncharacterized protein YjbI with pentapeptide repeats